MTQLPSSCTVHDHGWKGAEGLSSTPHSSSLCPVPGKKNVTSNSFQVRILNKKIDFSKVQSRCGSKDNIKHSAGGGNVSRSYSEKAVLKVCGALQSQHPLPFFTFLMTDCVLNTCHLVWWLAFLVMGFPSFAVRAVKKGRLARCTMAFWGKRGGEWLPSSPANCFLTFSITKMLLLLSLFL